MIKNIFKNLIPISIVVAGAFIAGALIYINLSKNNKTPETSSDKSSLVEGALTSAQVGDKVIKYLNDNILEEGNQASLVEAIEEKGLYKLAIKVGEQEFLSYASRDGELLFIQFISLEETSQQPQIEIPKTEKPEVNLFVMSFCPYGNQAEDIMKPVVDLLGDKFNFNIRYIVSKDNNGNFISLHGEQELSQDVREICVFKYQKEKFWDFVDGINKKCNSSNADSCWEGVATGLGVDVQKIKNCQKSEANSLLEQELKAVQDYGATGSPQLFVNGVEYKKERTSEAYKKAICSGFSSPPSECERALSGESGAAEGGCQ